MIEQQNGSLRVQGTDTVSVAVFNQVFDSLDRLVYTAKNVPIITSNQIIASYTPSTSSNLVFYVNMYAQDTVSVTADILFQNLAGAQTYSILDNYQTVKDQFYSFYPIFLSTNTSSISVVCTGNSTSFSVSIEKN
jgi:hypothetical protein